MKEAVVELFSDFWYAITHSIGYALVANEFILWIIGAFLIIWIAGIIYNETNDQDALSSTNKQ